MKKIRTFTLEQIVALTQGRLVGDPRAEVAGVSDIEHASKGTITFFRNRKYLPQLQASSATAVFVSVDFDLSLMQGHSMNLIFVANPMLAFAKTAMGFIEAPMIQKGIDQRASIAASAEVDPTAVVYPFVFIGENSRIGPHSVLFPGVFVGNNVVAGANCIFYPRATVQDQVEMGNRVILKPGAVVGSEGFGFTPDEDNGGLPFKVPQMGNVRLEDDVEIGANTTIDRATLGTTLIGKGTKIDNLVHIAHNCVIGENTVICAQCGISGSTTIGNRVIIAGHVGTKGHVRIGDNVVVAAQTGVSKDIAPNQTVKGYPPRPLKEFLRQQAVMQSLPEMRERLLALEEIVRRLTGEPARKSERVDSANLEETSPPV